jgi:hypothetical protein
MAFGADDLADEQGNIAGTAADIQNAHARAKAGVEQQLPSEGCQKLC